MLMSTLLAHALKELNLQPGEVYRTNIDGRPMEIRDLRSEDESRFTEHVMIDIRLNGPSSPQAKIITVFRSEPIWPSPFHLDESDLAPE
jgi:hypothetical protein